MTVKNFGFSHPSVAQAHVNLAWINVKQGKDSDCQAHLERGLQTDFLWSFKSFLETEGDFGGVRDTLWFQDLLKKANKD